MKTHKKLLETPEAIGLKETIASLSPLTQEINSLSDKLDEVDQSNAGPLAKEIEFQKLEPLRRSLQESARAKKDAAFDQLKAFWEMVQKEIVKEEKATKERFASLVSGWMSVRDVQHAWVSTKQCDFFQRVSVSRNPGRVIALELESILNHGTRLLDFVSDFDEMGTFLPEELRA